MTDRLPPRPGEWIDRSRTLDFTFEGRSCTGFAGDTITRAAMANGVRSWAEASSITAPRRLQPGQP